MAALTELGIPTRIHAAPNEVEVAIPFAEDEPGYAASSVRPSTAHYRRRTRAAV
ncbi:MAG TPA: hypothetical protein VFV67_01400 [Actinophytocola sp.]|uniref:hypothetical protein n=1 Tax=Actinophytocola sp. TaxID=1872138 RepID=UPI002DB85E9C|nr:hypothetical protein [Actinophytocola sp.]HEU5469280.1 hypothetical protein [Actinophytocola sp.]